VQIAPPTLDGSFDGQLKLANAYDFTPLSALTFRWEWLRFPLPGEAGTQPRVLASGQITGPDVAPHSEGRLALPRSASMGQADALRLTARRGEEDVMRWVWPVAAPRPEASAPQAGTPQIAKANGAIRLTAGRFSADFDEKTGLLHKIASGSRAVTIAGGPRLVYAHPASAQPLWSEVTAAGDNVFKPAAPGLANIAQIDFGLDERASSPASPCRFRATARHGPPSPRHSAHGAIPRSMPSPRSRSRRSACSMCRGCMARSTRPR
jgi:hypothetical protein